MRTTASRTGHLSPERRGGSRSRLLFGIDCRGLLFFPPQPTRRAVNRPTNAAHEQPSTAEQKGEDIFLRKAVDAAFFRFARLVQDADLITHGVMEHRPHDAASNLDGLASILVLYHGNAPTPCTRWIVKLHHGSLG